MKILCQQCKSRYTEKKLGKTKHICSFCKKQNKYGWVIPPEKPKAPASTKFIHKVPDHQRFPKRKAQYN